MRMAGDARRYPRSVAAAGCEKDRLDLFPVTLEAERLLSRRERRPEDAECHQRPHRITNVWLRLGAWPTRMRATSVIFWVSMTETLFEPALAA